MIISTELIYLFIAIHEWIIINSQHICMEYAFVIPTVAFLLQRMWNCDRPVQCAVLDDTVRLKWIATFMPNTLILLVR